MAKARKQDAAPAAGPAEPTRAAVWQEQPDMMRSQALAVLTYLGQVARQAGEEHYSRECVVALGWNIHRMVGAIRAAEGAASPLDYVTYEFDRELRPVDTLDRARECLTIIAEHHQFRDDMGFADAEDDDYGLAVLAQVALAFLKDAESQFNERMGQTPDAPPSQEGEP